MSEQIKIDKCTSCGSDQIVVAGNKFLCRPCNIVYEVTDTGTKVLEANPLDEHEQRLANAVRDIAALKKAVQGGEIVEQPAPDDDKFIEDHPEPTAMDEDGPDEEDGFIIFE
jgi:hypothetical protein